MRKELVKEEIGCGRTENEAVEHIRHSNKCRYDENDKHYRHPYQHPAQSLEMTPERHLHLSLVDLLVLLALILFLLSVFRGGFLQRALPRCDLLSFLLFFRVYVLFLAGHSCRFLGYRSFTPPDGCVYGDRRTRCKNRKFS